MHLGLITIIIENYGSISIIFKVGYPLYANPLFWWIQTLKNRANVLMQSLILTLCCKKKTLYNFMIIHTTWPFFETEMTNWISKNTEFKSTLLFRLVNFSKSRLIILENFKRFCFSIQSYFYSTFIFSFSHFISSSMWGSTLQMGWSRTSLQKASIL